MGLHDECIGQASEYRAEIQRLKERVAELEKALDSLHGEVTKGSSCGGVEEDK